MKHRYYLIEEADDFRLSQNCIIDHISKEMISDIVRIPSLII
jgi:hypothetical protein